MTTDRYRVAVRVKGEQSFNGNGRRFASIEQAKAYASDLAGRWFLVEEARIEQAVNEAVAPDAWVLVVPAYRP